MLKMVKKLTALALVAVMTMACFVGCAQKEETVDPKAIVMKVGETEVTAEFANFYLRYNQSLMESIYETYIGADVWKQEVSTGYTYEDSLKDSIMDELQEMILVVNHVDDYKVALTDEEKKAVEDAATSFFDENKEVDLSKIGASKDTVIKYLTMYTLNEKMAEAMKNDINSEVTTEEAKQKRARYYVIKTVTELDDGKTMSKTEDEIKKAKEDVAAFLKGAKEKGDMSAYATETGVSTSTVTFNSDSKALNESVIKAADALKEKEFSEVIEVKDDGIYVLQLESMYDEIATEKAKEDIKIKRQDERYEELLKKWKEETTITVFEEVWGKISVQALKVNYTYDPKTTTEE